MRNGKDHLLNLVCAFLFLLAVLPTQGRAGMFYFHRVTSNSSSDVSGQLSVEVLQPAERKVSFEFWNRVGTASSITDIYFYDGTYISGYPEPGLDTMIQNGDVSFGTPARPAELPGYKSDPLGVVYSADSDCPVWASGINAADESLKLTFDLYLGRTFDSLLEGLRTGDFVIGLHVQGIGTDGKSDSYVTPLPASILLGVFAVGLAGRKLRTLV